MSTDERNVVSYINRGKSGGKGHTGGKLSAWLDFSVFSVVEGTCEHADTIARNARLKMMLTVEDGNHPTLIAKRQKYKISPCLNIVQSHG